MLSMTSRGGALPPNQSEKPAFLANSYAQGGTSFTFRKRWGHLDWRKLASVDVDRIAKEMDFQTLQQNIMNITFCNIETEEFQHVDSNFIKIFKLSQLVIEYLLHSQQYLSSLSTSLEQKLLQVNQELDKAMNDVKAHEEELKATKKENRKRRKVIEAYQDMISAGATGLHACPVCKREFVSSEYLQSHIQRRHPNHLPETNTSTAKQQSLRAAHEDLEAKLLEQMTQRLLASEKHLKEELKQKEQETLKFQMKDFENWKREEKQRMTIEIEDFKRPIIAELEELRQEKKDLEKTVHDKEAELRSTQSKRQSHLGHLEGARELILDGTNKLNESKAEIEHLKETLEAQMQEMQRSQKEQDKSWQRRMQKLSTSYRDQLTESVSKLESLEQSILEGSRTDGKKVSNKLKSLQQKMKQQGELLVSQREQLISLQSREPSPTITPAHDKNQIHSDESSESDNDDSSDDYVDHHGEKCFSPISHCPMIKTIYPHKQEDIDKIRRQTQAVFSDVLVQRGLQRDTRHLKNRDFEEKMSVLQQERQHKVQTHFHFAEHRQRIVDQIEETTLNSYKPTQLPSPKPGAKTAVTAGKPPKPTSKISAQQESLIIRNAPSPVSDSIGSDISITTSYSEESDGQPVHLKQQTTITENPVSENTPTVIVTEIVVEKAAEDQPGPKPEDNLEGNNSWDSEDSIEELEPPKNGRGSSTPIKVQSAVKSMQVVQDSVSVDSFDLSSSDPVPTSQPSKVELPAAKAAQSTKTVTSQSALTSVSLGDFDSDSDSLDISDLT